MIENLDEADCQLDSTRPIIVESITIYNAGMAREGRCGGETILESTFGVVGPCRLYPVGYMELAFGVVNPCRLHPVHGV